MLRKIISEVRNTVEAIYYVFFIESKYRYANTLYSEALQA